MDSLWQVWESESYHDTIRLEAISTLTKRGFLPNEPDTAFILAKLQYDFAKTTKNYRSLVDAINTQGTTFYFKGDHEQAEFYYSKCMQESQLYNIESHIAKSYNNLGMIYAGQARYNKAIDYYKKSLVIKKKDTLNKRDFINTLNNIGKLYSNQGDYINAVKYYSESLRLSEKHNEYRSFGNSLNNLGTVYKTQKDYDKALEYYEKSLLISQSENDKRGVAAAFNNIGIIYRYKKEYDTAIEYLNKSLKLREEVGDLYGRSKPLNNLSNIYNQLGQHEKALACDKESLAIQQKAKGGKGLGISLNNIATSYYSLKQYQTSLKFALEALQYAEKMNGKEQLVSSSYSVYKAYNKLKMYKEALKYYRMYVKLEGEVRNEVNQKAIIIQEYKSEYEKQKAIDDLGHEKRLAVEKEAKAKQKILTYATGVGLALVAIFLFFVFNRLKITRKQKGIIEIAHTELEVKNQEITDSIQYAKRIQNAILPHNKVVKEHLKESFILYKPKDIVAGDFYWMESVAPTDKKKEPLVLFAAADCTGHGVPGAMVSVVCNNGLNRSVREHGLIDPGKILDKTREIVVKEFEKSEDEVKDGMDIALCSLEGNLLKYAGAHNPLWIIRDGELMETKANKQPIGPFDFSEPYITHAIELQKGDTVYIFSDGYADQFGGEKGKKMKTSNFKKLLLSIQHETMEKQKESLEETFINWKSDLEQLDDVCVIGVRV